MTAQSFQSTAPFQWLPGLKVKGPCGHGGRVVSVGAEGLTIATDDVAPILTTVQPDGLMVDCEDEITRILLCWMASSYTHGRYHTSCETVGTRSSCSLWRTIGVPKRVPGKFPEITYKKKCVGSAASWTELFARVFGFKKGLRVKRGGQVMGGH